MNFKNLSITIKLPMAFVLLTLFVVFSISYLGYRDFRGALLNQTESKLRILTHERGASIRSWFEGMSNLVQQYGTDPNVIKAIQGFSATFGLVMDDPVKELKEAYILNNPHPIGEKDSLDRAEKPIPYNYQHEAFHPFFRNIKNSLSLYDVFLFDLAGNLIYSVYKEADFATNFETGIYSKSGLGIAFRAAKNDPSGGVHFVDFKPYAPSAGDPASFMATAIQDTSGNVMGVFAIQLPADQLTAVVNEPSGLEATGELTLIAEDQKARSDSRFEGRHNVFKILDFSPDINAALGEREGFFPYQIGLSGKPSVSLLHGVEVLGHKWVLLGEFETAEVYDAAVAQRNKTVLFSSIAIAGMAVIAWLLSRSFTNPLIAVINSMAKIGNREYDIDLSSNLRGDEIGDLSRALGTMSDRSQEYDRKVEEEKQHVQAQEFAVSELGIALKKLANNDLSHYLHTPFAPEYEALRQDFNDTVMNLKATVRQLIEFSTMIENQTTIMSKESSDLSTRTENQAATLEETAAAVHQITGKVKSSALELKSAEKLTLEASSKATKGQTVVESTSNAMSEIEQVSKEIHDIIGVVDDIAFQTNLLALNAGVEAARAGEAGQGFAVVALEVGQLANRTTDSVGTIKSLIENSGRAVHNGVELVSGTEAALTEIVNHIASISDLITSVAGTSGQQSDSLAEVNIGVSQLDQATQKNVEMVDQSNATARELKDEAVKLVNILSGFDLGTQPIEAPDLVAKQTALRSSSGLKRIA